MLYFISSWRKTKP